MTNDQKRDRSANWRTEGREVPLERVMLIAEVFGGRKVDLVSSYLDGVGKDEFLGEPGSVQDGVVRQLEIIGEAARGLSDEFKKVHSEIPWKEIVGMRKKIIHEYFSVDWLEVWNTSQRDVPALKEEVQKLL